MLTTHRSLTAQGNRGASSPMPPHQRQRPAVRFVSMSVLSVCLLVASSMMPTTSWAEENKHTVQSGENLNKIVRKYYPDLDKREQRAMMQRIVDENPKGFIGNSANGLKLGAELVLPDDPNAESSDSAEKSKEENATKDKPEKADKSAEEKSDEKSEKEQSENKTDPKLEKESKEEETEEKSDKNDKDDITEKQKEEKKADSTDEASDPKKDKEDKEDDKTDNGKDNNAASDKTADAEQITQLKSKNEQLESLLEKYEAEIEILQAKSAAPDQATESKDADTEALTTKVEQMTALAEKYELENEALKAQLASNEAEGKSDAKSTDQSTSDDSTASQDGDTVDSLKAQVAQLEALAEKYETELDELKEQGGSTNRAATHADDNYDDANIATLKTELTEKDEQIAKLNTQVADLSRQLAEAESNLVLKWVLGGVALFALLFGFYLISSRLHKRADEAAAEELKSVMASAEAAVEKSLDDKDPEEDNFEADIKLDIAKAYLELNNSFAAHEILQEVLREGSTAQQTKAQKLLEQIQ